VVCEAGKVERGQVSSAGLVAVYIYIVAGRCMCLESYIHVYRYKYMYVDIYGWVDTCMQIYINTFMHI